jgi:hypothetical protein
MKTNLSEMGEIQQGEMVGKVLQKMMKFIPWDELEGYETCIILCEIHPIDSSIKRRFFSYLLVMDFHIIF